MPYNTTSILDHLSKKLVQILLLLTLFPLISYASNSKKILINEFLASNATGIVDVDGDYSDWIELYNAGSTTINLSGWGLTDNINKPKKWVFPSVQIRPNEYLVVFASSKDKIGKNNEIHTNFSLSRDGEYLGIIEPNGTISDEYTPTYPPQETDISYGYYEGERMYFTFPTPGEENTLKGPSIPKFSHERGYYENPITVTLTTVDPDTKIYYSTDGTQPTARDQLYTKPIRITSTTPLSVVGYKNSIHTNVISHTYFYIDDIIRQDQNPEGYPDRWGVLGGDVRYDKYKVGERAPAHYGMDQGVINDPDYHPYIKDAFLSIPTVSIVTKPDYLFSGVVDEEEGGIYIHTGARGTGRGWERPVSIEYFDPQTQKQFQVNSGLRMHGAASRQPEKSGKHALRAHFRKIYGAGKLREDVFEESTAVQSFDHLLFRAGFGYSWTHWLMGDRNHSQYVIDSFAKKTQLKMGHHSAHSRFVNLYINGLFWGVYDVTERLSNNFMEAYFGGEDVDYDVMNQKGLVDGSRSDFDRMVSLAQRGRLDDLLSERLIEVDNYIDYMLLNFYLGNLDWGNNNWYAARNRERKTDGFRFFAWDSENCFFSGVNFNTMLNAGRFTGPLRKIIFGSDRGDIDGGLLQNDDFRLMFADRVQKHFFNGGALSPESTAELYTHLSEIIDLAIILESARWGTYRRNTLPGDGRSPVYTRNDHFLPQKEKLLKEYFPKRTEVLYNQLKDLGLASNLDAPRYSVQGGEFVDPFDLEIISGGGSIYYTTDGTDPRTWGSGDISASATRYTEPLVISSSVDIKARSKRGSTWSALSELSLINSTSSGLPTDIYNFVNAFYSNDELIIDVPYVGAANIAVYTMEGKSLLNLQTNLNEGKNNIALTNLQSGVYICRIHYMGSIITTKFIK